MSNMSVVVLLGEGEWWHGPEHWRVPGGQCGGQPGEHRGPQGGVTVKA